MNTREKKLSNMIANYNREYNNFIELIEYYYSDKFDIDSGDLILLMEDIKESYDCMKLYEKCISFYYRNWC